MVLITIAAAFSKPAAVRTPKLTSALADLLAHFSAVPGMVPLS